MGLFDFFKRGNDEIEEKQETARLVRQGNQPDISFAHKETYLALRGNAAGEKGLTLGERAGSFVNAMIPAAAAAVDAGAQYGMAVVRFPEGVGWADLCKSPHEGYKLLSNFKDGKFNEMAAIKQAGLQAPAVANLALQGAAVVVGQAYMAQINEQLASIEAGIGRLERAMELERQAKLRSAYDMAKRYALRFDEYQSSEEKRIAARNQLEGALKDSREMWHYQLAVLGDLKAEVASSKKMKEEEIVESMQRLRLAEEQAASAFQLQAIIGQMCMQYDSDFSTARIDAERSDLQESLQAYSQARGGVRIALGKKVEKLKGAPIALADAADDSGWEKTALPREILHGVALGLGRVRPDRMVKAARKNNEDRKAKIISAIDYGSGVQAMGSSRLAALDDLEFIFNEADTMILENGEVRLLKSRGEEEE